ncbi:hypothetical protein [Novosphingobium sp. fls2-241-R2A-195]|uniref:hypothetical protein n=1 Tax=Novosphingobium sp. fls2-241-R2A-195 TaxID=3040296 RepID=UPI0025517653|nr:hypothetical protein [Novosphingobium sp. fls2-241-R2A-195]
MIRKALSWLTGVPEIVWPVLALALIVGGVILWDRYDDAQVVEKINRERAAASAQAGVESAEDRADRVRIDLENKQARELAIARAEASEAAKAPEARSTVSAQDRALNCERLRQAGLTGGAKYRELCQ